MCKHEIARDLQKSFNAGYYRKNAKKMSEIDPMELFATDELNKLTKLQVHLALRMSVTRYIVKYRI